MTPKHTPTSWLLHLCRMDPRPPKWTRRTKDAISPLTMFQARDVMIMLDLLDDGTAVFSTTCLSDPREVTAGELRSIKDKNFIRETIPPKNEPRGNGVKRTWWMLTPEGTVTARAMRTRLRALCDENDAKQRAKRMTISEMVEAERGMV